MRGRQPAIHERYLDGGAVYPERSRRRLVPRWVLAGLLRLVVWVGASAGV